MEKRKLKIIVDILLLFFFIFSLRSGNSNMIIHIIVGLVFALICAIHVFLNGKWLISVTKTLKMGKLSKKVKWLYRIDLLLLVVWSIAILSGFPAIGYAISETESLFAFSRIHGISSRLGCLLVIIHIFQHRSQIGSYIKRKKA